MFGNGFFSGFGGPQGHDEDDFSECKLLEIKKNLN